MKALTGRSAMKSPGKPSLRRDVERLFWREIARGLTSEEAAVAVGVSQAVGGRWFRQRGGMPLFLVFPVTGRYLSFPEREEIATVRARGVGVREIARRLGRDPSTVAGTATTSTPWPPHSTAGHARHSAGRHQPKNSTNCYSPFKPTVLQPPVEYRVFLGHHIRRQRK
jgi:hypothetical protein